jgi:predicted HTH domain antitoxin
MQYRNSCLESVDRLIREELRYLMAMLQGLLNATSILREIGHLSFTTTAEIALMEIGMFVKTVGRQVPPVQKGRML